MDKYRLSNRILKCKPFTCYKAQSTVNRQSVLVKKLHKGCTWEQILKNKQLSVMKHAKTKFFPNIKEIVKEEQHFYIILQPLEQNLQSLIKTNLPRTDILKVCREFIQMLISFKQVGIVPRELRPAYFFVKDQRQTLKLVHLEITSPQDISKLDLVQLQDLKYLSPEQVLTSKQIDDRSTTFTVGLILFELLTGKSLINANTKMNYMYEICRLFPGQHLHIEESHIRQHRQTIGISLHNPNNQKTQINKINLSNMHQSVSNPNLNSRMTIPNPNGDSFDKIMSEEDISPELTALLKEMLKIDRSERVVLEGLLQAFDLIASYQICFQKGERIQNDPFSKPSRLVFNEQQVQGIKFDFQTRPTLSTIPNISSQSKTLLYEQNIEDDAVQPIIIKQSSKPVQSSNPGGISLQPTKESSKQSRITQKNPFFTTIKKPQLTNYALNQINLGVQVGINPTLFSENDI